MAGAFYQKQQHHILQNYKIDGLGSTLIASILISICDLLLRWVLPGV